jgi:hypothetical protein
MNYASSAEIVLVILLQADTHVHIQAKVRIKCVEMPELLNCHRRGFHIVENVYAETDIS